MIILTIKTRAGPQLNLSMKVNFNIEINESYLQMENTETNYRAVPGRECMGTANPEKQETQTRLYQVSDIIEKVGKKRIPSPRRKRTLSCSRIKREDRKCGN